MVNSFYFNELNIPSTTEGLDKCLAVVDEIGTLLEFDFEKKFSLQTIIVEAVENAIIHGNRGIRELMVKVIFSIDDKHIVIEVKDAGEGFVLEEIVSPVSLDNIRKECGRGIYFIKMLSSDCYTIGKGNLLRIIIDR